jgi:hypothetical protein
VAQELLQALNKVTFRKGFRKWQSVRAAVITSWKKDQLNGLAQRLNDYRQQLTLRLLVALNSQCSQDREQLGQPQESHKEIVEVVSISYGRLRSMLKEQYGRELDWDRKDQIAAEIRHAETIAAILTTRDGVNRTIMWSPSESNLQALDVVQTATTYRRAGFGGGQASVKAGPGFSSNDFTHVPRKLLDSLYFCTIYDRRELIAKAHRNTCEWIFRDPNLHEKPWDSFIDWLRKGRGCYWICGKAGSGKSTLLKYIQDDRRTVSLLAEWAGTSELLVCSFYFSIVGTPLQKSHAGLLRSLLFELLSRKQELLPLAFPNLCRLILANPTSNDIEPSFIELKTAFRNVVAHLANESKVCVFVDGQDYDEIYELFSEITSHSSFKIVVSSRPIPACVEAFSKCAKLRLQDLTHDDIMLYVKDKVVNHPLMRRLDDMKEGASDQLTKEITSKASGVFLWVILVTKSLLNGLRNYDHISDLLDRLEMLPDDLEKLYDHMLNSVGAQYRHQCSRILQVVSRSIRIESDFPMTVLQLSFIEEKDPQQALEAPVRNLPQPEEDWLFEATEGRLRSRCGGPVEVQDLNKFDDGHKSGNSVGFLHRSVSDYLLSRSIWDTVCSWAPLTSLDVDMALLSSGLYELKAKQPDPKLPLGRSRTYGCILRMLAYCAKMGIFQSVPNTYLNQLRRTAEEYWPDASHANTAELGEATNAISDGCHRFQLAYPSSFLFLVACQGPSHLLQELLKSYKNKVVLGRFSACLLLQFFEKMPGPVRRAIAASMKVCRPNPYEVHDIVSSAVKSVNARWEYILRCPYRVTGLYSNLPYIDASSWRNPMMQSLGILLSAVEQNHFSISSIHWLVAATMQGRSTTVSPYYS